VIGTYRDVEVTRRHPLSQTLGELTRERLHQPVRCSHVDLAGTPYLMCI